MNRNYIGILYAGKEPNDDAIRALVEVLRDILHVFPKDIQIATLNEQEIAKSLARETLMAFALGLKNDERANEVVERSIGVLVDQFKSLPSYIVQDKIPTNVLGAYMIHVYNISSEPRKYTLTSAVKKVLGHDEAKKGLMKSTSAKYVAALINLLTYVEESQKSTAG